MKYTLLELTQSILRSMESDEVSSINETQESRDVVDIIKECYFDIAGYSEAAEQDGIFKLDASTDDTKPVLMTIPSHVVRIDWLKYNYGTISQPDYSNLFYISNEAFIDRQTGMDPNDAQSMTVNINGTDFVFKYWNDRYPRFYTIFDEHYLVFDGYDADEEDTLTNERSLGYGRLAPIFLEQDTFIPDLDHRQFQLLLQDAKSTAHVELKQQPNPKAEQKYRQNRILSQKTRDDNDPRTSRQRTYGYGRHRGIQSVFRGR